MRLSELSFQDRAINISLGFCSVCSLYSVFIINVIYPLYPTNKSDKDKCNKQIMKTTYNEGFTSYFCTTHGSSLCCHHSAQFFKSYLVKQKAVSGRPNFLVIVLYSTSGRVHLEHLPMAHARS